MRPIICLAAVLALGTVSAQAVAQTAAFQLNQTTWKFTDKKGVKTVESIDETGNFIAQTPEGKHLDHGTAVMKGDKACFTSAMTNDGEECWTTQPVKVGHSMTTTSDKGEKLMVSRVDYTPFKMPK